MNILYIDHYAGAPQYGSRIRTYELSKRWVEEGHNVRIVASKYTHLRAENPIKNTEKIDDIEYFWLKTTVYKNNNIWRFWNVLVFLWSLYTKKKIYLKAFKPDVVIASSTYPMDIFPARKIAKKYKAKLVFELHDLWPLSLYELSTFTSKNPFAKWVQYAEDYYCKYADKVISVLPYSKKYLITRGMDEEKWYCIANGINTNTDCQQAPSLKEEIEEIRIKYSFLIGYVGTLNRGNNLELLLNTPTEEDTAIILIGSGANEDKIDEILRNNKKSNVFKFPKVPYSEVLNSMKEFDILYRSSAKKNIYKYGIAPMKLYEYMLSGRPILHAIQEDTNDLVKEANCGISTPPDDTQKLAEAIKTFKNMSPKERDEMGARGKKHVIKNYDYDILAKQFLEQLK